MYYYYGTYVLANLGTKFYFCVIRVTYSRYVLIVASLARLRTCKLCTQRVKHLDKSIIYFYQEAYYSSKVKGISVAYMIWSTAWSSDANDTSKLQSPSLHSPVAAMAGPWMYCRQISHLPEGRSFRCTFSSITACIDWLAGGLLNQVSKGPALPHDNHNILVDDVL